RIVLVTDGYVYVFRDYPFHIPGARLAMYERGPGLVRIGSDRPGWFSRVIRRGQLTFSDGTIVYHAPIWIRRAQYIAGEGNVRTLPVAPSSQSAAVAGAGGGQWAADPTGRHHHRWWDGQAWTHHVSTNGVLGTDPM
ncbi:MAG TPA: DUF2510 domain-containing protein, partial [Mycobacteriales bacterium]|nr:DUF2510 domain-containing protein [Mycobacteriales bacterium]